jgi:hypothetical protein
MFRLRPAAFGLVLLAPLGCAPFGSTSGGQSGAALHGQGGPTYWQDARPILRARCTGCHAPGEIGAFSLTELDGARKNADMIAKTVRDRVMPPFPPDTTGCEPLDDPRLITDDERGRLVAWAENGTPEGDPSSPAPDLPAAAEVLGPPTDTFDTGFDYAPAPPEGEQDDYHCFVIDPRVTAPLPYHAVDVASSNRAVSHHAIVYVVSTPEAVAAAHRLDDAEPGPGYSCFGDSQIDGADEIGGWVPGEPPQAYPKNTGSYVAPGELFVLQMHYNIVSANGPDRPVIRLWRPSVPFAQIPGGFDIESYDFQIPPRATGITAATTAEVVPAYAPATDEQANAGLLWQVGLHTHLLSRSIRMDLVHADGTTQCLLDIPKWDFNWQGSYNFATPVPLVAGDHVRVDCTWDNPTDRTVGYGNATSDEMCQGWGVTTAH